MTIDPQILEFLREDFKLMARADSNPYPGAAQDIRQELARMGLNLNDDATYELLQPGLTKQKFDDLEFLGMTYAVTRRFHQLQAPPENGNAVTRHHMAEKLVDTLERFMPQLKNRAAMPETDPYHVMILHMLMEEYASGRLQDYRDNLAVNSAQEHYTELQESLKDAVELLADDFDADIIVWEDIFHRLKSVKELVAAMPSAHRDDFFARISSDSEGLNKLHRDTALLYAREILKNPQRLPDEPDTRFRDVVQAFKDAGINIQDEATYNAIDIAPQTFWDNYKKEEEALKTVRPRPRKPYWPGP